MTPDLRILLVALALTMWPGHALAQATPEEIIQFVADGDFARARSELAKREHSQIDRLYVEAQIFTVQGDFASAAQTYRAILSIAPGLIPIRQLLADVLLRQQDYDGARFQFERLMEIDQRPAAREAYSRALAQIRRAEPSGINVIVSFTPSTNINRGSQNTTFESGFGIGAIDPSGREQSGIGIRVGATGFLKIPGNDALWTMTAGADKTFYSNDDFDYAQGYFTLSHQWVEDKVQRTTLGYVNAVVRNISSDLSGFGLTYTERRILDGPDQISWGGAVRYVDFDAFDTLDGFTYALDLGWQRQVSPTMSVQTSASLSRSVANADKDKYWGFKLGAGVSRTWVGGWSSYVGLETGLRAYDDIFTFGAPVRRDEFVALSGSILNSQITFEGFAPRINCLATRNWSNISFFDYEVLECGVQFTRGF